MGRKHTHYSTEFRAEAVRLAETSGRSIRGVALDLGISNQTLGEWLRESRERPAGTPLAADERAELEELRRRVNPSRRSGRSCEKQPPSSLRRPSGPGDPVPLRRAGEGEVSGADPLLCPRCLPERLLRLALAPPVGALRLGHELAAEIRRSHVRSRGTYGVPRIHADLAEASLYVSRKRVARLMRRDHLAGVHRRRFVRTTIRDADAEPWPDLVDRDFTAEGPDRL